MIKFSLADFPFSFSVVKFKDKSEKWETLACEGFPANQLFPDFIGCINFGIGAAC